MSHKKISHARELISQGCQGSKTTRHIDQTYITRHDTDYDDGQPKSRIINKGSGNLGRVIVKR